MKILIGIGCVLLGSYVLIRAVYHYRKGQITINGEEITGIRAKRYSILFMIVGSMAIVVPLLAIIFGKG